MPVSSAGNQPDNQRPWLHTLLHLLGGPSCHWTSTDVGEQRDDRTLDVALETYRRDGTRDGLLGATARATDTP